jgi:hypothetical protein
VFVSASFVIVVRGIGFTPMPPFTCLRNPARRPWPSEGDEAACSGLLLHSRRQASTSPATVRPRKNQCVRVCPERIFPGGTLESHTGEAIDDIDRGYFSRFSLDVEVDAQDIRTPPFDPVGANAWSNHKYYRIFLNVPSVLFRWIGLAWQDNLVIEIASD